MGLATIGLFGVYGWRGKNDFGGTTVLAELEHLHLRDRRVLLAFDSDIMLKPSVHDALTRLYQVLEHRGADVGVVMLPVSDHGQKCGLDDYLAAGHGVAELFRRVELELPTPPSSLTTTALDTEPITDETVTLAGLLGRTVEYYRRFIVFPNPHQPRALALWVAHAWFLDAFDVSPRLLVTAPTKRSAKTRVLDITAKVTPRAKRFGSASGSVIFRSIETHHPTMLIDEIDRVFRHAGTDPSAELVAQVINVGWERGSPVARVEGQDHHVEEFEAFAATALAGIDKGFIPDTTVDRSVRIQLRRRRKTETVEKFRKRGQAATDGDRLRGLWAGFVESHVEVVAELSGLYPEMPTELHDRAQDAWEPLVAIAEIAGGSWPEYARAAARALAALEEDDDDGAGVLVLRDLERVWPADEGSVKTKTLVEALQNLEDCPWETWGKAGKGLTGVGLANLLKPFGIRPGKISIAAGHHNARGYEREHFADPWSRYSTTETLDAGHRPVPGIPTVAAQGIAADPTCPSGEASGTPAEASEPLQHRGRGARDTSTPENDGSASSNTTDEGQLW